MEKKLNLIKCYKNILSCKGHFVEFLLCVGLDSDPLLAQSWNSFLDISIKRVINEI